MTHLVLEAVILVCEQVSVRWGSVGRGSEVSDSGGDGFYPAVDEFMGIFIFGVE